MKFTAALISVVGVASANYKSGSVSTYEKFNYGKFITRMKTPDKKGTVSSFFTYWDGPGFYQGGWNELDVEIVPSVESNPMSMNIIYGDGHNKLESHDYAHDFQPSTDWHTYEMSWTPDYISWAIDGMEIRHVPASDASVQFMNKAQSLRMNFWTPTFHSWGDGFDPHDMPWYVLYDYVEVFTYDENTGHFDFDWRDDFDAFDSGRWHKASGGFEANSSVFYPSNVYTSGGNLVLKMEPMDHHDDHHGFGHFDDHQDLHAIHDHYEEPHHYAEHGYGHQDDHHDTTHGYTAHDYHHTPVHHGQYADDITDAHLGAEHAAPVHSAAHAPVHSVPSHGDAHSAVAHGDTHASDHSVVTHSAPEHHPVTLHSAAHVAPVHHIDAHVAPVHHAVVHPDVHHADGTHHFD